MHFTPIFLHTQILWGCSGSKPSEVAISFIYSFYNRFEGGIYWNDGNFSEGVEASFQNMFKVIYIVILFYVLQLSILPCRCYKRRHLNISQRTINHSWC